MKLGSLFDGSGGFPLAGSICGIEPVWASEVEPYPIAVTKERFPGMKHLGNICLVNGAEIEPVDIITFGSPCQDLSVAGKRAGLKHEANGDEETTRSGLFMEAVRIIKEMREATDGIYPRFALWENVPGAFSSNKGEDFRIVLEEIIKIVEPGAVMPEVPKGGWAYADSYIGDGWSLAYRVFDAQYWGVPQRRRRIHLVADFRGGRAGKILFEHEGLRGDLAESGTPRERTAGDVEDCIGTADRKKYCTDTITFEPGIASREGGHIYERVSGTLRANAGDNRMSVAYSIENHPADSRVNIDESGTVQCLTSRMGTGGGNVPLVMEEKKAIPIHDMATRFSGRRGEKQDGKGNGMGVGEPGDPMNTLTSGDRHAVAYCVGNGQVCQMYMQEKCGALNCMHDQQCVMYPAGEKCFGIDHAITTGGNCTAQGSCVYENVQATIKASGIHAVAYRQGGFAEYVEDNCGTLRASGGDFGGGSENLIVQEPYYIVRRLTPTECARLQGFPDDWGHIEQKEELTDEEYAFWTEVRCTHAVINGREPKTYNRKQMLAWYNKLHTDSAEYKMWGNGIALPPAVYCMQGIAEALKE